MAAKKGGPQKQCPECGTMVHAASKTCKKCQHEFVSAKPAKKAGKGGSDVSAYKFALSAGGVDKAKKALEALKANAAMDFAIANGGIEAATKKLAQIEAELAGV